MDTGCYMRKAVIFPERILIETEDEVFAGYIEGTVWMEGENRRLSRAHRQPNRIYAIGGIHPTISATETQGRYWIVYEEDNDRNTDEGTE